jgi:hypothetical protein
MSAHGRFTARPEESYRAALAPTLTTAGLSKPADITFSHEWSPGKEV